MRTRAVSARNALTGVRSNHPSSWDVRSKKQKLPDGNYLIESGESGESGDLIEGTLVAENTGQELLHNTLYQSTRARIFRGQNGGVQEDQT